MTDNTQKYYEDDMRLQDGATCRDCVHFRHCERFTDIEPTNTVCDWSPSRFSPSRAYARSENKRLLDRIAALEAAGDRLMNLPNEYFDSPESQAAYEAWRKARGRE